MACCRRLPTIALFAALLTAPQISEAQDTRAVLELLVNAVPRGEALVVLREGDVLIGVQRLEEAGVQRFTGTREIVDDIEMVSLASLAGPLSFSIDEVDLRLRITASPALLAESVRTLADGAPADMVFRSDPSAFLNYAVNWSETDGGSLVGESGVNIGPALLLNTFASSGTGTRRGLSAVTVDDRRRMRRWAIGDAFARTGALGGDAWIGGITLTREFGIEPYFVRYPSLSLSTPVTVPSTVEVHVNGRVVSRDQVEPGRLDMRDLPLTVGRNDARVIVRDAFGGSHEVSASYYLASSVLAPGIHDYQYSVGFRRDGLGTTSWGYKEPVALARHRVGVTDWLTAGGRLEASRDLLSLGPSVNLRVPVGEIDAAAAISTGREGFAGAMLAGYTYGGRPLSAGGSIVAASSGYSTVGGPAREQRPAVEGSLFASMGLPKGLTMTVQHAQASLHGGLSRSRTALLGTVPLGRLLQLTASVARVRDDEGAGREAFVGVSMQFGRATTSTSVAATRTATSVAVEVQEPLPVGIGYGYQARVESGAPGSTTGAVQYQGPYGRYEVRHDAVGASRRATLSASGALVAIGGGIFASRPVHQSFALVRVPGVEGVRGFASNQEVGRTNAAGDLLVPDLQPYYGNLLNISDSDVPLEYSVEGVRLTLALPYRGGALALFPVKLVRRVTGSVRVVSAGAPRIPQYGELRVTAPGSAEPVSSPVGADGEFYFENLPSGRLEAVIEDEHGACAFPIEVPESAEPFVDLGEVQCEAAEAHP